MTFLSPGWLWLLAGVVALAAVYLAVQLYRRRVIARYAHPERLAALVPSRPGARRYVAPLLLLAGLAAVVVGLARPARDEVVARREGVVVLALDVSASMTADDVAPTRLDAALASASDFVGSIPEGLHVGLVAFDGNARVVVAPTTDHAGVIDSIEGLTTGPGTASGEGIYASLAAAESVLSPDVLASGDDVPATIVLMTDGMATVGRPLDPAAEAAAEKGIPISTIAFGTAEGTVTVEGETVRVPADPVSLARVADISGGSAYEATSGGELDAIYGDIRTAVGTTTEPREVTRVSLGAAFVAVLAAVGLSIIWAARAI